MKKPDRGVPLSGDHTGVGFNRGLSQAEAGETKKMHLGDINPVNFAWRYNTAHDTYFEGLNSGYDAGLRKAAGVYSEGRSRGADIPGNGGNGMSNLSYQDQLRMIDALVEKLSELRAFFGTIRDGYSQNITRSQQMGFEDLYIASLREREARLGQTMDELERIIDRHRNRLQSNHGEYVRSLIAKANS